MHRKTENGVGWGRGAVSSRSFDLLNSMIYDVKRSVDLLLPVLHSSLDDFVFSTFLKYLGIVYCFVHFGNENSNFPVVNSQ